MTDLLTPQALPGDWLISKPTPDAAPPANEMILMGIVLPDMTVSASIHHLHDRRIVTTTHYKVAETENAELWRACPNHAWPCKEQEEPQFPK